MRTVYVNGEFIPENEAKVSVFDRGFLFADAVYEVTTVLDGKLVDFSGHRARLRRSLGELNMAYSFNWSPEGVVNEYLNDCEVIEAGERKWVSSMFFDPWLLTIPGVGLFLLMLAINLTGDGLRDVTGKEYGKV